MAVAEAHAIIPAPAHEAYRVLADYRGHRPHFLPRPPFQDLQVEAGGVGAGTRFRVDMHVLGHTHKATMEVSEPAPGHILEERDVATGLTTRFVVDELSRGTAMVAIRTAWPRPVSLEQRVETRLAAGYLRGVHQRLLEHLHTYLVQGLVHAR